MVLTENGYLRLSSRPPSTTTVPMRYEDVLGNEGLMRLIVSYL